MDTKNIVAIAKQTQGNRLVALALLNLETQAFNLIPIQSIPQSFMTKDLEALVPKLPTWGVCDNKMMLVGKDGSKYRVYYNSQILRLSIDEVLALHNRGFALVNFTIVRPSNAKAYLKLTRGSLYDYSESSKLGGGNAEAPVYVVMVDAVIEDETCDSFYYYRDLAKAKKRYRRELETAKHTAKEEGWVEEQDKMSYSSYQDGYYNMNHIDVTLQQIKFSDDEE